MKKCLFHLALVTILMLAQWAILGYRYSLPIHSDLLPLLKHSRNPELYQNDWRVEIDGDTEGIRGIYSAAYGRLSAPFPLPAFELAFSLLMSFALMGGIYTLGWQITGDWRAALLAGLMILPFYVHLGGQKFVASLPMITSEPAKVGVLWALILFRKRPFIFSLCLGLTSLIHISIGSIVMLTYGLAGLFPLRLKDGTWWRRQFSLVAGYALGLLPVWFNLGGFLNRAGQVGGAEENSAYIPDILLMRAPWHFDPFYVYQTLVEFALIVFLFAWLNRPHGEEHHAFWRRFFMAGLGLCLVEIAFNNPLLRVGAVMSLFLVRIAQFLYFIALVYLAWALVRRLDALRFSPRLAFGLIPALSLALFAVDPHLSHLTSRFPPSFYLLFGSLIFLLIPSQPAEGLRWGWALPAVLLLSIGFQFARTPPPYVFEEKALDPIDEMYFWIRDNTGQDAVFVIPPTEDRFQALSERAMVVNRTSIPLPYVVAWQQRVFDVLGLPLDEDPTPYLDDLRNAGYWDILYSQMDESRAAYLREKYSADYLLIPDTVTLDLPEAHRCCGVVLYRLDD